MRRKVEDNAIAVMANNQKALKMGENAVESEGQKEEEEETRNSKP